MGLKSCCVAAATAAATIFFLSHRAEERAMPVVFFAYMDTNCAPETHWRIHTQPHANTVPHEFRDPVNLYVYIIFVCTSLIYCSLPITLAQHMGARANAPALNTQQLPTALPFTPTLRTPSIKF